MLVDNWLVGGGLPYGAQLSSDHLNLLSLKLFIQNGTTRLKELRLFIFDKKRDDDLSLIN